MNAPYKTLYEDQCFLRQEAKENMQILPLYVDTVALLRILFLLSAMSG
jgi:hypothetical protein